jgi:hypothetical protein
METVARLCMCVFKKVGERKTALVATTDGEHSSCTRDLKNACDVEVCRVAEIRRRIISVKKERRLKERESLQVQRGCRKKPLSLDTVCVFRRDHSPRLRAHYRIVLLVFC